MPISKRCDRGLALLSLLLVLAMLAIAALASVQLGGVQQRRDAEEELLFVGAQFRDALTSYANASPPGTARAPMTLEDLLRDPRYPVPRRHLRRIYLDPLSSTSDWGLVPGVDGWGIAGVYSKSAQIPIKQKNFDAADQAFEGAGSYREWEFSVLAASPLATSSVKKN